MKAKYIIGKHGRPVLDYNDPCPFVADNDFEDALLFFLHKIGNAVEDLNASTLGEIDNAVEAKLFQLEETLSAKLDAVIEELRLIRKAEGA